MFVERMLPRAHERLAVIDASASIREVADLMSKPNTDLVVVCDQGEMVGVVTKTDIVSQIGHCIGSRLHSQSRQHNDARCYVLSSKRVSA